MAQEFARNEISLANWRLAPFSAWSFQNVAELVPSAEITRHTGTEPGPVSARALAKIEIDDAGGGPRTVADYLERSHTESFVVLRDGAPLAEWHAAHTERDRPHLVFSISKSITGMLAGIAVGEGLLNPDAPVNTYLPVADGRAYAAARVRDLLDMSVEVDFVEDYLDMDGDYDRYRRAMLWNPERGGKPAETLREVLVSLGRAPGQDGERFRYLSPNTDMLGLVIEAATGVRYHRYLAERLWRPMGARGAATVTVDRAGTARAAGGISVTAMDLARFGQLVLDGGKAGGKQIIPADWIADMRRNGRHDAWVKGNFAHVFPSGRYRSCWYQSGDERDCFAADGIHGQRMWIDPVSRVVVVKLSSLPVPSDDPATMLDFSVMARIARSL